MKELVIVFLVSMLHALVPRGFEHQGYRYEGAWELKSETAARFREIAEAAADVAYDPSERAVLPGRFGRGRTAVLLLAVAFWESSFRKDVDLGVGKRARGDSGNSWCLMQLQIGSGKTQEGWTGPDLVADRRKCFTAGLHLLQQTWGCGPDQMDALSTYASGRCVTAKTVAEEKDPLEQRKMENIRTKSAQRVRTAIRWGVGLKIADDKAMEPADGPSAQED